MAMVRRILIGIVGLLLIVDAGALAYVKFTSGPAPSDEKSKLVLWIDNAGQAKTAAGIVKEQGFEAVVKPDKRKTETEADFRVAMKSTKKELLKPIEQILRQAGHKQLSYSDDGTKLYYGGFYKQKAQAVKVAEMIKSKEQLVFEVVPGVKVVAKPSTKVVIASMPSNLIPGLLEEISAQNVTVDDQSEVSLEPVEPAEDAEDAPAEDGGDSEEE